MENKRVTKAMQYEDIIAMLNGSTPPHSTTTEDAIKFVLAQIEQVNKKNASASDKPTKEDIEKDRLRTLLYDYMTEHGRSTCTEMLRAIPDFAEYNVNKVVGLLKKPLKEGIVVRSQEKDKIYFSMA